MTDHIQVQGITWRARWSVERWRDSDLLAAGLPIEKSDGLTDALIRAAGVAPYDVTQREGNLLVYGGASALWDFLIAGGNVTPAYNNANAYLGVGNSVTAAAATQTDLLGTADRQGMEATYPQHTDGTGASSNADIVFRSQWGSGVGNFAWEEWGTFNAAAAGRMLNRKVEALGTKSGGTWTLTVTLTLS